MKTQNQTAFEILVTPYLDSLYAYCLYITSSKWDGDDLFQEVLTKLYLYFIHSDSLHINKPFLVRVAKNLWIDNYRKQTGRMVLCDNVAPPPQSDANYAVIRSSIERLTEYLPKQYIGVFLLSEVFRYSMKEIADETGCTIPAIKSVLYRARSLLRTRRRKSGAKKYELMDSEVERWVQAVMNENPLFLSG